MKIEMETQQNKVRKFTSLIHHMKGKYKGVYLGGSHFVKNYIPILFLEKKGDKRNLCESLFSFIEQTDFPLQIQKGFFPFIPITNTPPQKGGGRLKDRKSLPAILIPQNEAAYWAYRHDQPQHQ